MAEESRPTSGLDNLPASSRTSRRRSCSSSSTSSSDGSPIRKRRKQDTSLERRFEILSQQLVSHVNNILCANFTSQSAHDLHPLTSMQIPCVNTNIGASTSTENQDNSFLRLPTTENCFNSITNLEVSVKEPPIAQANPDHVTKITSMQRFDTCNWNAVRYTDAQKKYVAYPAFIDLKINEELRRFEDPYTPIRLSQMERTYAALSNAFLTQNDSVNIALQAVIDWSAISDTELSPSSIYNKLRELFGNASNYQLVSQDALQIMCGKRAEIIELRRRSLLKSIKDKLTQEDLSKIPPSPEYMFNPKDLAAYIQKIGGIDKIFKQTNNFQPRAKSPEPSSSKNFRGQFISKPKPTQNKQREAKVNRRSEDTSAKRGRGQKDKPGRRFNNRNKKLEKNFRGLSEALSKQLEKFKSSKSCLKNDFRSTNTIQSDPTVNSPNHKFNDKISNSSICNYVNRNMQASQRPGLRAGTMFSKFHIPSLYKSEEHREKSHNFQSESLKPIYETKTFLPHQLPPATNIFTTSGLDGKTRYLTGLLSSADKTRTQVLSPSQLHGPASSDDLPTVRVISGPEDVSNSDKHDAFSTYWQFDLAWIFPPPSLLPQVLRHLNTALGRFIIIAPTWIKPFWRPDLKNRAIARPRKIHNLESTLVNTRTGLCPPQIKNIKLEAWLILGGIP